MQEQINLIFLKGDTQSGILSFEDVVWAGFKIPVSLGELCAHPDLLSVI